MPALTPDQREYVDTSWKNKWESVLQAQNQVVNWIFALHGGGVAGLLALAASKGSSQSIKIGVGAFSLGLTLIILFGVFMFYFEAHHFQKYRRDLEAYMSETIDSQEFSRREQARPYRYCACEILAWGSGLCGLAGIITAVVAIL